MDGISERMGKMEILRVIGRYEWRLVNFSERRETVSEVYRGSARRNTEI
jgi:hypothetical protein